MLRVATAGSHFELFVVWCVRAGWFRTAIPVCFEKMMCWSNWFYFCMMGEAFAPTHKQTLSMR